MVKSAGEVSPVFEKKMKELLSEHGIDDPEPEEWYDAEAFTDAVDQATDRIGSKTIAQAGEEMGYDVPKGGASSPHKVLEGIDQAQQDAYRGSETRPAGSYTYERLGERSARCAVTEDFAYPDEISKGSLTGTVKDLVDRESDVVVEEVDTRPTEHPEKSDERSAYRIEW
jgi:hypothetical protein